MHRFYCPSQNISTDKIIISDKFSVHHLRDALRLKVGDEIIVFDDKGNEYSSIIEKLLSKTVMLEIKDKHKFIPASKLQITVACAIPKKSKMDDIIDKLTQLGVNRIIPLLTERVIVKLDKDKEVSRLARWRRIALSSAKQSQRNQLPIINSIRNIKEVLSDKLLKDFDLKLIPTLTGNRKPLKEIICKSKPKNILVLIGPEGDFTSAEIVLAIKAGCIPVSLGDLVLRVETAAIAVTSFIRLYENG